MPHVADPLGPYPAAGDSTACRRLLDEMVAGNVPIPLGASRLGLPPPASWSPGQIVALTDLDREMTLPSGIVFGGYIACLVDHFAGLAMLTVLPDGASFVTATLEVRYQAPLRQGRVRVQAAAERCGSRQVIVSVAFSQDGRTASQGRVEQIVRLANG